MHIEYIVDNIYIYVHTHTHINIQLGYTWSHKLPILSSFYPLIMTCRHVSTWTAWTKPSALPSCELLTSGSQPADVDFCWEITHT